MRPEKLLDNFSTHLKNALARAISLAASLGYTEVTPGHLLYATAEENGSIGAEILARVRVAKKAILAELAPRSVAASSLPAVIPELNESAKHVLEKAMIIAFERGHSYIGTEHLLYGLIHANDERLQKIMRAAAVEKETLASEIEIIFQSTSRFPEVQDVQEMMEQMRDHVEHTQSAEAMPVIAPETSKKKHTAKKQSSALDVFTIDLTNQALQSSIDPVIGRAREIERLIHILSRRTKNNPILVGEPGVGKTAIVEGLAKRITEGTVPDILLHKKIVALDLTLLIAGTIYRGEFEARLKQLIDELSERPDYILFIDEIHNIVGTGSNQGTMDAANILKPALARGKLHCIGATTLDEYTKYVTTDPALERRFQPIMIEEPTREDTVRILHGIKRYYEDFHGTTFTPDAIVAAVDLAVKYIHDNFLPDKAIDLLDEAAAAVRTSHEASPLEKQYRHLLEKLAVCQEKKEAAIQQEQLEEAIQWKEQEKELQKKVIALEERTRTEADLARKRVSKHHIVRVLANRLNLPEAHLMMDDLKRIERLRDQMKTHIVGQDHVIERIVQALRRASLGLKDPKKPLASFLFAGPSGVGKTAMAKALAKELYQDDKALVQFDMSEFVEGHSVSKLLGSPAGYIGHKERNRFTDDIRKRPMAIILFDEFDKAHPDVQKLLLQILEEGELTDSHGKKLSFRHAIIILTANVEKSLYTGNSLGFGASADQDNSTERVTQKLKEIFGSSIIGRIQTVCAFLPLNPTHVEEIIRRQLKDMTKRLLITPAITIQPDAAAVSTLAHDIYRDESGVRNVEHILERIMHDQLIHIIEKRRRKKTYTLTKTADAFHLV